MEQKKEVRKYICGVVLWLKKIKTKKKRIFSVDVYRPLQLTIYNYLDRQDRQVLSAVGESSASTATWWSLDTVAYIIKDQIFLKMKATFFPPLFFFGFG